MYGQSKPTRVLGMASYGGNAAPAQQRRGGGARYQSLLYRDLGMPPSSGRVAAAPAATNTPSPPTASFWRDTAVGSADPPPPPVFTLDDRLERTPTEPLAEYRSPAPDAASPMRTTPPQPASAMSGVSFDQDVGLTSPSWWSPIRERSSLLDNAAATPKPLTQQGSGLLTLPAPREIIRPLSQKAPPDHQGEEGDEWVTIYGFSGEDTNAVLREFEKCGPIVRHVAGPPSSNWLHIQYQSRQDAQKALMKNGMQLYGALIIGVKPVDPMQKQALLSKSQATTGFMVLPPNASIKASQASSRPYYLQAGDAAVKLPPSSTIASPSKSMLSKLADLVFGF